jgi:uncharacterized membrane protein
VRKQWIFFLVMGVCWLGIAVDGLFRALTGHSDVETVPGWIFLVAGLLLSVACFVVVARARHKSSNAQPPSAD